MKRKQNKNGLTLVEILVAVLIIAILAAGLYSVSNYLETQSKIKLTKSTIEILCTALEQYRDFYGKFPFEAGIDYGRNQLQSNEANGLNGNVSDNKCADFIAPDYNDIYSSSEALYYFLNQFPAGKKIVDSINRSLLTNKGEKGKEYFIRLNVDMKCYPLIHIIDPWKYPLRYTYEQGDNFPLVISAGPDKDFNEPTDNISSR
jgi:prepilin-type N-terminal cleavage/methylation domain-containing protein